MEFPLKKRERSKSANTRSAAQAMNVIQAFSTEYESGFKTPYDLLA